MDPLYPERPPTQREYVQCSTLALIHPLAHPGLVAFADEVDGQEMRVVLDLLGAGLEFLDVPSGPDEAAGQEGSFGRGQPQRDAARQIHYRSRQSSASANFGAWDGTGKEAAARESAGEIPPKKN